MRFKAKLVFTLSLLLNIFLIFNWPYDDPSPGKRSHKINESPITFTNSVDSDGNAIYIAALESRNAWWSVNGDVMTMSAGVDQKAVFRLDGRTGRVKSTTIGLINLDGQRCLFTDMNADGMPDKKHVGAGTNPEVYYQGDFYPTFNREGQLYLLQRGSNIPVTFKGDKWVASK